MRICLLIGLQLPQAKAEFFFVFSAAPLFFRDLFLQSVRRFLIPKRLFFLFYSLRQTGIPASGLL